MQDDSWGDNAEAPVCDGSRLQNIQNFDIHCRSLIPWTSWRSAGRNFRPLGCVSKNITNKCGPACLQAWSDEWCDTENQAGIVHGWFLCSFTGSLFIAVRIQRTTINMALSIARLTWRQESNLQALQKHVCFWNTYIYIYIYSFPILAGWYWA